MRTRKALIVVATLIVVASAPGRAQDAATSSLNQPLQQFTLGDIFPKISDASTQSLGESWKADGDKFVKVAQERVKAVDAAIAQKKAGMSQTKASLKAAKSEKDFVKTGTLEGTLKNDEMVLKVLEQIKAISQSQAEFAKAWSAAGSSLVNFVAEDAKFDAIRSKGIAKPDAAGQVDNRLDASGVATLEAHTEAMAQVGKSFSNLGGTIGAVASKREAMLVQLEKAGQIQPKK